jgi:hypothetical protein
MTLLSSEPNISVFLASTKIAHARKRPGDQAALEEEEEVLFNGCCLCACTSMQPLFKQICNSSRVAVIFTASMCSVCMGWCINPLNLFVHLPAPHTQCAAGACTLRIKECFDFAYHDNDQFHASHLHTCIDPSID